MTDGESGAPSAAEAPANDYVLYSESEAQEQQPAKEPTPEAKPAEPAKLPDQPEGDEGESSEAPKKMGGFQRKLAAKDARIQELEQEVQKWRPQEQVQSNANPVVSDGRPDANDPKYNTPTGAYDYNADLAKWNVDQVFSERDRKAADARAESEYNDKLAVTAEREASFIEEHPDYLEKLNQARALRIATPEIEREIVLNSEKPELVGYHLATHLDDLRLLSGLDAEGRKAAIGIIEQALKVHGAQQGEDAAVRTTRAAAPISPVKAGASTNKSLSDDAPYEDWVKQREASLRR